MKKLLCILLLVVSFSFHSKAQWVTIPDARFAARLALAMPTCMNGNQMDINCAATAFGFWSNGLDVSNDSIYDLTGIQYFTSLYDFNCQNNRLTTMPALPNSLKFLRCDGNQLTSLGNLPSGLYSLSCGNNLLTLLPNLDSLTWLDCPNNQLTVLPPLPNSLYELTCYNNQLTSLPTLPYSLNILYCGNNNITSLPQLPSSLTNLVCNNNQLTTLPALPSSLTTLNCGFNNITCFPQFPSGLYPPVLSPNPFHCLPNYIPYMSLAQLSYPLCVTGDAVNNPDGCAEVTGFSGRTFREYNANCSYDSMDTPEPNLPIKIYNSSNAMVGQTYSFPSGIYDFPITPGTYTVKLDTAGMPYTVHCPYPGPDSTLIASAQSHVNFDIECKPGFDLGVRSVLEQGNIFPGQYHTLRIDAGDLSNLYNLHCASGVSGLVTVSVTGPLTYQYSLGTMSPSVSGNVYTYTINNFGTLNAAIAFDLVFKTDTTATIGDSISVNVTVTPVNGDNNVSNNNLHYCYYVVNSFDPNYKEVYPKKVPPGFNGYLTYSIHFQNTGSAPAINILIRDSLDLKLDWSTLEILNSSHYCTKYLSGKKLTISFPNIQLADSTTDFEGSQGFIQYRIKPLANLPAGTLIRNAAYIYFDYNPRISTNTTFTNYVLGLGQDEVNGLPSTISIYPNPSNGKFSITFSEEQKHTIIKVTNLLGECIEQLTTNNKQLILDLSSFANGIYFVKIEDENQNINYRKIVKE